MRFPPDMPESMREKERRTARTVRESERSRRKEKRQNFWYCRDQRKACKMAQALIKNLNTLGLPNSKVWPQRRKESSWQGRKSFLSQKRESRAIQPNHKVVRREIVKVGKSRTLGEEQSKKLGE